MFEGEEGGFRARRARAATFFTQFHDLCPKDGPYQLTDITSNAVHHTISNTISTAPSFDKSLHKEARMIPHELSAWIAKPAGLIEGTGKWPEDLLPTRAIFLAEPAGDPNNLTDYRVRLVTSTV